MATYEEAIRALRAADEAGDVEAARELARIADRLRNQPSAAQSQGADIFRRVNTGIAQGIGLPVDLTTMALRAGGADINPRQVGGGAFLRDLGARANLTAPSGQEPQNLVERAAEEVGLVAVPTAGILARGARLSGPAKGAFDRMAQEAAKRPGRTAAFEGASAVTAATGGEVAEQFSDSPAASAIGELLGGFAPTVAVSGPAAMLARRGVSGAQAALTPFTEAGGKIRASRAIQARIADPERALRSLRGQDVLALQELSPARRIGEGRILAMERAVLNENPALDEKFSENLAKANVAARQEALKFQGDPNRTRKLLTERRDHLIGLVDLRAAQAARKANDAVAALGPEASLRETSRTVRANLQSALREARADERRLWEAVPSDAVIGPSNARSTLADEIASRGRFADPEDIPKWLRDALGEENMTVKDALSLRSRVLDEAANARAGANPNRNKARILGNVQEALLEDIGAAGDIPEIQTAMEFSRRLNDKFTRGAVGRVLRHDSSRGGSVDPSETMELLLGGSPLRSVRQVEQLLNASPQSRGQVEQYMRTQFAQQVVEDGVVNRRAAARFMDKHKLVLDQFPDMRGQIDTAIRTQATAQRQAERAKELTDALHDKRVSRTALYLDGPVGEEMTRVLSADDPPRAMAQLMRQVRSDPVAQQGLKHAYVEGILGRSRTGEVDDAGEFLTSGKRFRRLLIENEDVSKVLLSNEERARLSRVAETFARIDAKPSGPETAADDVPAFFLRLGARWLGAQAGQRLASGMGSSLVMAQGMASEYQRILGRLTRDKANKLISDAIQDPKLFEALMTGPTASAAKQARAIQRINAWMAVPASTVTEDQ